MLYETPTPSCKRNVVSNNQCIVSVILLNVYLFVISARMREDKHGHCKRNTSADGIMSVSNVMPTLMSMWAWVRT